MAALRFTPALLAAGLVSGLAMSTAAWAQTAPAAPSTPPTTSAAAAPSASAQTPPNEQWVEKRITQLHSKLHITAAQQPQWDQFVQVMRSNASELAQGYQARKAKLASMTAPENMQSFADLSQQRAQDVQKLVPAFQTLYASLSNDQKQIADQMFRDQAERMQTRHRHVAAHP